MLLWVEMWRFETLRIPKLALCHGPAECAKRLNKTLIPWGEFLRYGLECIRIRIRIRIRVRIRTVSYTHLTLPTILLV